ncbi:tocopherol cyclase family protein [Carnobacterium funditum]|uniref:tocopherol cyclase family protein n=1 Tax=Carnobacterium funditum TaxID=2752 RepID=UPI00055363C1|nr:tocopherol cyclase family protein [Carnobacterium funditum]
MTKKLAKAILFQGNLEKKPYFEGWYYKQVSNDGKQIISLIPGISLSETDSHSFVQYIMTIHGNDNKKRTETGYISYPINSFDYQQEPFQLKIGPNVFTESKAVVRLTNEEVTIQGTVEFGEFTPIKHSLLTPNIMGIFAYFPMMECVHGIVSMNHSLTGSFNVNGAKIDFSDGKGYIERDWGKTFPREYVWIQSNHFENNETSLFFSEAHIPFLKTAFQGFICNLVVGKKEYRFATYHRDSCKLEKVSEQSVKIYLENKTAKLIIEAEITDPGELVAPTVSGMQKVIKEELGGNVKIELYLKKEKTLYKDETTSAGIEIVDHTEG